MSDHPKTPIDATTIRALIAAHCLGIDTRAVGNAALGEAELERIDQEFLADPVKLEANIQRRLDKLLVGML